MSKEQGDAFKKVGNGFFGKKDYASAIVEYTKAIEAYNQDHTYFSNRSACYCSTGKFAEAAEDARKCISITPSFLKGYMRLGLALENLGDTKGALDSYKSGQKVDRSNADMKTNILRLEKILEEEENAKKKGMSPAEALKAKGNDLFKAARFEDAIVVYTQALNKITDKTSPLAISCFNNRAACNQQISNFSAVIEDASMVLETEPMNIKALMRRGLAFEGMERYRSAITDMSAVLSVDPNNTIANGTRNRCRRSVETLRAMK